MHLPPQAAGPDRSRFSYNIQIQAPEKPRPGAELKPQSPSSQLKSAAAPALRAGTESLLIMNVVTNIPAAVTLLAGRIEYTLVSGPHGPLTRRYAPTAGKPLSGPLRPRTEALSWLKAGMALQGEGMDRRSLSIPHWYRRLTLSASCHFILPPYMR